MADINCAHFQYANPEGTRACGECGAALSAVGSASHSRRKPVVASLISIVALAAVVAVGAVVLWGGSDGAGTIGPGGPPESGIETPDAESTVAIAINAGGDEVYFAAVFDADGNADGKVTAPEGYWYLLTFNPATGVRRSPEPLDAVGTEGLRVDQATERMPGTLDDQRRAFEGLLQYFVTFQSAYLVSLDALTEGFTHELFDLTVRMDGNDAVRLHRALNAIDAAAAEALTGIEGLGAEASAAAPGAGPSGGLFDFLKDRIEDPIKAQERAKKARSDVALAFGRMTIQQQQAAFQVVHGERGLAADAVDSATFVEMLDRGELDNEAAQIRLQLQNDSDFYDYFDLRNIETAAKEAAKLVIEGANFYGKAIKKVLDKTFPGIGKGWDLVEKLEKDLQKVDKAITRGKLIAEWLRRLGQPVTDEQAAALAAAIDTAAANMTGAIDEPGDFDTARIGPPIGRIDAAEGGRKTLMIALQYDNPKGATLSLRCKFTGPASADVWTQSVSETVGIATFTFDVGYAPKNGTYEMECSLDDYVRQSASFAYAGGVDADADPSATPAFDPDELDAWIRECQTPVPTPDPDDPDNLLGAGDIVSGIVDGICEVVLMTATALASDVPVATSTPAPAATATCAPRDGGDYDPIGGLGGGRGC